jgi:hypothetical protein
MKMILFFGLSCAALLPPPPLLASSLVLERGPHHRVVQTTTEFLAESGERKQRVQVYTALADGMHYWENGKWLETQELIEPFPGGAVARHGPYKVIFSPRLRSGDAVDLEMPDGRRLRFGVLGLALTDQASGHGIILAEARESLGEILPPNRVIYRDAFDGVKADMLYVYKRGAFEADVILRENIPLPDGFDPTTTRLEVLTQFVEAPNPRKIALVVKKGEEFPEGGERPDLVDESLDFGEMKMVLGRVFQSEEPERGTRFVPVAKRWEQVRDRSILTESVEFLDILPLLDEFKETAAVGNKRKISNPGEWPWKSRGIAAADQPMQIAKVDYSIEPGLVIDFVLQPTYTDFTFQTGQTYLAEGSVTISGTATFENGAIIKYDKGAWMTLSGPVICPTKGDPVILTARDDNSVGADVSTGPLSGYYGNPHYLHLYNSSVGVTIQKIQFRYAKEGVTAYTPSYSQVVRDSRFENCEKGVAAYYTYVTLRNLIFCNVGTSYFDYGSSTFSVNGITTNCDGAVNFVSVPSQVAGKVNLRTRVISGDEDWLVATLFNPEEETPGIDYPPGITSFYFQNHTDNPFLPWDTRRAPNDTYGLIPMVEFMGNRVITGPQVNVQVQNDIHLPEWYDFFTWELPITAIINAQNQPYTITIKDDKGVLLRTLQGVSNGIEEHWDGYDENGLTPDIELYVDVTISFNPQTTVRSFREGAAPITGKWLIMGQDIYSGIVKTQYQNNMQQIHILAAGDGGSISGNVHYINTPAHWDQSMAFLKDLNSRQLFYFGHGSPKAIGYNDPTPKSGLTAAKVGSELSNLMSEQLFRQPFRFVFLSGCRTAPVHWRTGKSTGEWPESFGIFAKELTVEIHNEVFGNGRARAFVGWKKSVLTAGSFDSSLNTFHLRFFENWIELGQPLQDAINGAAVATIGSNNAAHLQTWGAVDLRAQTWQ